MKQMHRRDFFLAAGAASTMASVTRVDRSPIRAGLLGTQHSHTDGKLKAMLDSLDYEIVAVCEPDKRVREKRKREPLFHGLRWVSEEELLGDPPTQLIVAECQKWEAIPWGRKVIAANKHLHLEKPPGHELTPFRELVEEARRKGLLLQMGYVLRFNETINAAIEAARRGWLGDVHIVRGTINKDLAPERRAHWGRYKGGTLFDLGGHLIDRVIDLWGRPNRVKSWLRNDTTKDGLADNTLAVFEYDDGLALVSSSATMAGATPHRSFEVIGSDGSVVIQPIEPGDRMKMVMRRAQGPYEAGWHEIKMPEQKRFIGDFKDLARAIKNNQPLKYSYDHELLLHETLLRASGEIT